MLAGGTLEAQVIDGDVYDSRAVRSWPARWSRLRQLQQPPISFPTFGHSKNLTATPVRLEGLDKVIDHVGLLRDLRIHAVSSLFSLPSDHFNEWPGIETFFVLLEHQFQSLMSEQFKGLWKFRECKVSADVADCWRWFSAVLEALQHYRDDPNCSIENLYQHLESKRDELKSPVSVDDKATVVICIFAVLCWSSLILEPILDDMTQETASKKRQTVFRVKDLSPAVPISSSRRPIGKMFREFKTHGDDTRSTFQRLENIEKDVIFESTINFYSLYTVGRVRLKWVDTLSAHLKFDRQSRTLNVFRLPTFCVSNITRKNSFPAIDQIVAAVLPSVDRGDNTPPAPDLLYREVLLSYRLLFGQSHKSRKLIKRHLIQLGKMSAGFDEFLETLCTAKPSRAWFKGTQHDPKLPPTLFAAANCDVDGALMALDTYSARDDFPVFGERLLTLQEYSLRQQPSRVRDLWRDRRNPLQWYTFWAVVLVGGASVLLGILQLAVSIAQLYYAACQSCLGNGTT